MRKWGDCIYKITDESKRTEVKNAYAARTRHIRSRITFGHYVFTSGEKEFVSDGVTITEGLQSLSVSQSINDGEDITVGSVCSGSYSAAFVNPSSSFNYWGKIAFIESGILLSDESYFYMPLGYFNTEKPETDDDGKNLTVTGYDEIASMDNKWTPGITIDDSTTLSDVIKDIATQHGLDVDYADATAKGVLENHKIGVATAAELTEKTEREVLGYCVGCSGMSARINTVGQLYVSWYFEPSSDYAYTVGADVQWENGFKKTAESTAIIEAVTAGQDEDVYTKGTGVPLSFSNPLIMHTEIDSIYERYVGRTWQPATLTWRGNPCVEPGDIITASDKSGKNYAVYVASQEIDLTGGMQSVITSPNINTNDKSFDSVSSAVKLELKKVLNSMEQSIKEATDAINGANGGYYRILDIDSDGNPDGWECFDTTGLQGVKCTYGGIGCTEDGGKTYTNAMTGKGINAKAIVTGVAVGGSGQFSFDFDTGEIIASDVKITGGDINLDGGSLSIVNTDGYRADLSDGRLGLYQGAGTETETGYEYLILGNSLLLNTAISGDWYATIAAPEYEIGGASAAGVRIGSSAANAYTRTPVSGLNYNWDTDYMLIEPDAVRVRKTVKTNEAGYNVPAGLRHYRSVGGALCHTAVGVGVDSSLGSDQPTAFLEVNNEAIELLARVDVYQNSKGGCRLTLRGSTFSATLSCGDDGKLYYNGKALAFA